MNETDLQVIKADLHEIKQAVVGDRRIGLTGLVTRVERLEAKVRRHDLRLAAFGGGVGVIVFLVEHLMK